MEKNLPSLFQQLPGNINDGQKELLNLICLKYQNNQSINKEEIVNIYRLKVQRQKERWDNYYEYDRQNDKWRGAYVPYSSWHIEDLATSWLLRALGALMKKGYLTVIPRINLI